ncbi:penicillin-binding transpeptidase domain-containing protein [Desertimonas flava]|jgi:penicillin-binding protein 2|uniref:penicillin-binding transpeptidase domain-containing protein n=1 Tax=Desertimonas flava TaxID=2064846 RepID=UPI000E34C3CA|nr:penicillin-binding transpeptidase domain-containing protein [Desertimonas flava]
MPTSDKRAARLGMLAVVGIILFGALGARLWFLQAVEADGLQAQVDSRNTRTLLIPPERGQIFDVDGRLLAGNERVVNVVVSRDAIRRDSNRALLFERLSGWLNQPVEEMERRYDVGGYNPLRPLPLQEDVGEGTIAAIMERIEDFPGVAFEYDWRRVYPYAPLASHVIGYMGSITAEDEDYYKDLGYDTSNQGEDVGRAGVEQSYETVLHGEWGRAVYEIDSSGRVLREISRTEPINGQDVQLSIDGDIQLYAEQLLVTRLHIQRNWQARNQMVRKPDGTRQLECLTCGLYVNYDAPAGSVVVMNNQTGQVAAMASYPTYDNRWFGADIGREKFDELFKHPLLDRDGNPVLNSAGEPRDDPDQASLTNRAVQGQYNLGSTFKPFVIWSALMAGPEIMETGSTYDDDGIYEARSIDPEECRQNGWKCSWRNSVCGNGRPCVYQRLDAAGALAVSSDGFFYWLAEKMFQAGEGTEHELLSRWLMEFGFGRDTGIDLPSEYDGRVPTNANKADLVERGVLAEGEQPNLLLGDVINLSIGQGLLAATPIQLATAYSTLANNGKWLTPRVVQAIYAPNTPASPQPGFVDLSRAVLVQGMAPEWRDVPMPQEYRDLILYGLRDNILGNGRNGRSTTAGELMEGQFYNSLNWTIPLAGKTGTAQGANSYGWNDSSVFAAFNYNDPNPAHTYTVVAYLEKSGFGSRAAAPVVKCMFMGLADQARLPIPSLSEPLDLDSDRAAVDWPRTGTECMAGSDGNNVTPRPPTIATAQD